MFIHVCLMRSTLYGKKIVVYSAGTFGQQLINRFNEKEHCQIVAWVDDDYWEYRRCCLDVDPVENIFNLDYDYVLNCFFEMQYNFEKMNRIQNESYKKLEDSYNIISGNMMKRTCTVHQ